MWVPAGDDYEEIDMPLNDTVNGDLYGYISETGICGTGEVDSVACVLTDQLGTVKSLGYTCEQAMNINCEDDCPLFQYKVIISLENNP